MARKRSHTRRSPRSNPRGVLTVHGGGFGGWAQCYVPLDVLDRFICGCETALGKGSVRRLELCPYGAARI